MKALRLSTLLIVISLLSLHIEVNAQKPELVVQSGHANQVNSLDFSPDGRLLVSADEGGTAKLWDMEKGWELFTFSGEGAFISISFSPDGKKIAGLSGRGTIQVWELPNTVKRKFKVRIDNYYVSDVAFSHDSKNLLVRFSEKYKFLDAETGAELPASAKISTREFVSPSEATANGEVKASIAFEDKRTVDLTEVKTDRKLRTLQGSHICPIETVVFSHDGKRVATGGWDYKLVLWDAANGKVIKELSGHQDGVVALAFTEDDAVIASGSSDGSIRLWNAATGTLLRTLAGHTDTVISVAVSPDGKLIATGSGAEAGSKEQDTIKLWNTSADQPLSILTGEMQNIELLAFSPDSRFLASVGQIAPESMGNPDTVVPEVRTEPVKVWDLERGKELYSLTDGYGLREYLGFSQDSKNLLGVDVWYQQEDSLSSTNLWSLSKGEARPARKIENYHPLAFDPNKGIAVFHVDTLYAFTTGSKMPTIKAVNLTTGRPAPFLPLPKGWNFASAIFSPNGRLFAAIPNSTSSNQGEVENDSIYVWDLNTGRRFPKLKGRGLMTISPNNKILACASGDNEITLWEIPTGKKLQTLAGHSAGIRAMAFTPDSKLLVSGSRDTKTKVWEVATGQELASLISLNEDDWIVVTPDGLFDGSPAAWSLVLWRFGSSLFDAVPVEHFFNEYYKPGLLKLIFEGERPRALLDITKKDRRQPQLKLALAAKASANDPAAAVARSVAVSVEVTQSPAGAQDVRLFRNGSLVHVWPGDVLKGRSSVTLETVVRVVAGENNFAAYAFNSDNIKSSDAELRITGPASLKRTGVLYLLAIGVGKYENPEYALNYTAADAASFIAQVKLAQEKIQHYSAVEVTPLIDKEATKANILAALKKLETMAQPEDAVIVYFSGHGTAQRDRFYLIPHDIGYRGPRSPLSAAAIDEILFHSISDVELEAAFRGTDAGQLLLVIDACNSGQALEAEEQRRGPMNSKGLAQLAYEKGMSILTASQSYELAFESDALEHSYLTYALVEEALKNRATAADANRDGQVLLREWFNFAVKEVPRLRQREVERKNKRQNKALKEITPTEARQVQQPRVFYRREDDVRPMIIAKP